MQRMITAAGDIDRANDSESEQGWHLKYSETSME